MDNAQTRLRHDSGSDPDHHVALDHGVAGDEPMTAEQASYLQALSQQAREPSAFNERLTRAEASKQIEYLEQKIGLGTPDE